MKKQALVYCADFETTTEFVDPNSSKVWLYYIENIRDETDSQLGFNIDDFFKFIIEKNTSMKIYFHNLNYDIQFIIHHLSSKYDYAYARPGQFNPKMDFKTFTFLCDGISSIYKMKVKTETGKMIEFLCSYKVLTVSVSSLMNLREKEKIDYNVVYDENTITKEVKQYIYKDVKTVIPFIREFLDNNGKNVGITASSTAMKTFKSFFGKDRFKTLFEDKIKSGTDYNGNFSEGEWDYYKAFYLGGWTWIKPEIIRKINKNISVYDVNSLYPYVMRNSSLPVNSKLECKSDKCKHFKLIECYISFKIKPFSIPFIPDTQGMVEHITYLSEGDRVHSFFTQEMIDCIYRHYDVSYFSIVNQTHFARTENIFTGYIDYWQSIKQKSKKGTYDYLFSKIMQNSLYGKFGMNYKRKKYFMREKTEYERPSNTVYGNRLVFDWEWDYSKPSYIPIAIAITSFAKIITIDFANYCNKLCRCLEPSGAHLYNDTDSVHLSICETHKKQLENESNIDSNKLGYWDNELNAKFGYYIKRKLYFEYDNIDDKYDPYKASGTAGISKSPLSKYTYRDIIENRWKPTALSKKKVEGGILLIEKEKKINDY